jgi:hypothetical protein
MGIVSVYSGGKDRRHRPQLYVQPTNTRCLVSLNHRCLKQPVAPYENRHAAPILFLLRSVRREAAFFLERTTATG